MKKLVLKVMAFGATVCVLVAAVLAVALPVRLALAEGRLEQITAIPDGVEVLAIGNSHVQCTWDVRPEYKNRIVYQSSMPLTAQYFLLKEFERRGALDKIKVLIMSGGLCGREGDD